MESEDQDFPVYQGGQTFFPAEEDPLPEEEDQDTSPHWLLIVGIGLVALGLLARWLWRRR